MWFVNKNGSLKVDQKSEWKKNGEPFKVAYYLAFSAKEVRGGT